MAVFFKETMDETPLAPTDAALVERARRGHAPSFGALVQRHYRAAFAVALARVGSAMDAEDACQDAFLRALERLDDCRRPDRFRAWLLQIVRNRAHNLREHRRVREKPAPLPVTPSGRAQTDRSAERAELRSRLEVALAQLTTVQREVLLLSDLEGWDHRSIAEALEISEGMSRQHLFRARRAMREQLGSDALREYFHG